jgi:hypothetical protein
MGVREYIGTQQLKFDQQRAEAIALAQYLNASILADDIVVTWVSNVQGIVLIVHGRLGSDQQLNIRQHVALKKAQDHYPDSVRIRFLAQQVVLE